MGPYITTIFFNYATQKSIFRKTGESPHCHRCSCSPHSHPLECVIPDGVLIQVGPPDDEHLQLETCRGVEINTLKRSASIWSLTRIIVCLLQVSTAHWIQKSQSFAAPREGRSKLNRTLYSLCTQKVTHRTKPRIPVGTFKCLPRKA